MGTLGESEIKKQYDDCIYLNKLALLLIGIWPYKRSASGIRKLFERVHMFVIYFFIVLLILMQWIDMYSFRGHIDANTDTLLSHVFIVAVAIKISNFLKFMPLFKEILTTMRSNWITTMKTSELQENKEILYREAKKARAYSIIYACVIMSCGLMYCLMPLITVQKSDDVRDRKYPFFGKCYFDRNSNVVYGLCYLSQAITGTIAGTANFATDTIFLVCMYHFSAQLRILQNDLMDLGKGVRSAGRIDARAKITSLIRRHQAEIKNAQVLQSIFSLSSLQQLLVSCLMICINGFKLIVALTNRDLDFIMYALNIPLTLFQLIFYCQPGNELIVQSQSLDEAIYQSYWINLDRGSIKHLIFMIRRSQKPLAITAGKVYVLSLENFMKILKTSMSGLSVLQAMYRKAN